mgnify:CR=1 FL=1
MTTPVLPYARILFVGPDLTDGSFAELFRQRLAELRGATALADIVDTSEGYASLWQRVAEGDRPLLVIDLEPQSSSPHLDWLRSQLSQQSNPQQLFVASAIGQAEGLPVDAACALIERPELHLPCVGVAAIADPANPSASTATSNDLIMCVPFRMVDVPPLSRRSGGW